MVEVKIYYEDTDCGGVVYHANYLRYFEWARTEYMEKRGINLRELMQRGFSFMIVAVKVNYRSPARYGDILTVDTWIANFSRASFTFHYKIHEKSTHRLIVEGETSIVLVDNNNKLKRPGQELINKLKKTLD